MGVFPIFKFNFFCYAVYIGYLKDTVWDSLHSEQGSKICDYSWSFM